jgi:hypothetical protein
MKVSEAKNVLKMILGLDCMSKQVITPMLMGKPGVGKSESVHQLAKEYDFEVIDVRLSQLDSAEIRGIPRPIESEGICKWFPPEFWPFKNSKKYNNKNGLILFLDEFNRARPDVLQAVFQLIWDRKVGEFELADNVYIVCAGNYGHDDGCDVIEFDAALNNRLVFIDVDYEVGEWLNWASNENLNKTVINFIKANQNYLYYKNTDFDKKAITPRTWANFARIIDNNLKCGKKLNDILNTIAPTVIKAATAAFIEFYNGLAMSAENLLYDTDGSVFIELKTKDKPYYYSLGITKLPYYLNEIVKIEELPDIAYKNFRKFCREIITESTYAAIMSSKAEVESEGKIKCIPMEFKNKYFEMFPEEKLFLHDLCIQILTGKIKKEEIPTTEESTDNNSVTEDSLEDSLNKI